MNRRIGIISGGQTGVDRAALDVALDLGLEVGGWCPRGRRAEDGVIPLRYPLRETPSTDYAQRTAWNVRDSDGTLVLTFGAPSGGTALTVEEARRRGEPLLHVQLHVQLSTPTVEPTWAWIAAHGIVRLNVAGPRESEAPGIYAAASAFLHRLLSEADG